MMEVWRGTRYFTDLWRGTDHRSRTREKHVVGRCDLCHKEIVWGESYHINGYRLVHMSCEFQAWREREVAS